MPIHPLFRHIRQVVNDARQNRPSIKVLPKDSKADIETAEVISGLIRNIEQSSNADVAYDTAIDAAVSGGFGYWRVDLDYSYTGTASDITSMGQEIFEQDVCIIHQEGNARLTRRMKMFQIVEEKIISYNADGKTVKALVAYSPSGKCLAVARARRFETRQQWEVRLIEGALDNVA